jgi:hypothetical protein
MTLTTCLMICNRSTDNIHVAILLQSRCICTKGIEGLSLVFHVCFKLFFPFYVFFSFSLKNSMQALLFVAKAFSIKNSVMYILWTVDYIFLQRNKRIQTSKVFDQKCRNWSLHDFWRNGKLYHSSAQKRRCNKPNMVSWQK